MPMAPFQRIDFNARISAVRAVGIALGAPNASIPAQSASGDHMACLRWINTLRVFKSLSRLPSLDYTGFQPALNALAALVP
jgi:hypothetical protein